MLTFRKLLLLVHLAGFAVANAQSTTPFEAGTEPVKIVVPFAAGTGADIVARAIAHDLEATLKRTVTVDNRPGAGGNIGTELVAKATPDGRTMLLTVNNTVVINPILYQKLGFNAAKDLQPLNHISTGGYVVVVPPSLGVKTLADLLRRGKSTELRYGSYGNGTMSQICTEILKAGTGTKMTHIPYKLTPVTDLIAGEIELSIEPVGNVMGHIQSGRLVPLAVTTPDRLSNLPAVPTISETLPGYDCRNWYGMLLPVGTPASTQSFLQTRISTIVATPEFIKTITPLGQKSDVRGPADFGKIIQNDYSRWQDVVKTLNIRLE